MGDARFNAHPALGVDKDKAVQIVRNYDGRIFAMSSDEARLLADYMRKAADQADARRSRGIS